MEKIEGILEKLENLKIIFNNEKKKILKEFKIQIYDDFKDFLIVRETAEGFQSKGLILDSKEAIIEFINSSNWIFKNWILNTLKKDYKKLIYLIINYLLDFINRGVCLKTHTSKKAECKAEACIALFPILKVKKGDMKAKIWEELINAGTIR